MGLAPDGLRNWTIAASRACHRQGLFSGAVVRFALRLTKCLFLSRTIHLLPVTRWLVAGNRVRFAPRKPYARDIGSARPIRDLASRWSCAAGPGGLVATLLDPQGRIRNLIQCHRVSLCGHRSSPPPPYSNSKGRRCLSDVGREGRGRDRRHPQEETPVSRRSRSSKTDRSVLRLQT